MKWFESEVARMCLRDDGIVYAKISAGINQTPQQAHDNLKLAYAVRDGVRRPVLLDLREAKALEPETRAVYSSDEIAQNFTALAILTHTSSLSRIMANVYLLVARLKMPTRLFVCEKEATLWLTRHAQ